jgi:hypothetical protein
VFTDHGVLDPLGRAHQVLDPLIHELLVSLREGALFILLHCLLPALLGIIMAPELASVVVFTFSWSLVFALVPFRCPLPGEELESDFFEEVLDDVHHVWADVPYDVEQVKEG